MHRKDEVNALLARAYRTNIPFGKWQDFSLPLVATEDPGYIKWIVDTALENKPIDPFSRVCRLYDENEEFFQFCRAYPDYFQQQAYMKNYKPPVLTGSQKVAVETIVSRVEKHAEAGRKLLVRLQGGAGTGKTFTTRSVATELMSKGFTISGMFAPSYVAVEAIKKATADLVKTNPNTGETTRIIRVATVAKWLKLRKTFDGSREKYVPNERESLQNALASLGGRRVLVLDECSTVPEEICVLVYEAVTETDGIVILVGDSRQLPPPGEKGVNLFCRLDEIVSREDPAEAEDFDVLCVELTEPKRFEVGSPLHRIERGAVALIDNGVCDYSAIDELIRTNANPSSVTLHRDWTDLMQAHVDRLRADPGVDAVGILYRNQNVADYNRWVRYHYLGKESLDRPVLDDELLRIYTTMSERQTFDELSMEQQERYRRLYSEHEEEEEEITSRYHFAGSKDSALDGYLFPGERHYSGIQMRVISVESAVIDGIYTVADKYGNTASYELPCPQPYYRVGWQRCDLEDPPTIVSRVLFGVGDYNADKQYLGGVEYMENLAAMAALAKQATQDEERSEDALDRKNPLGARLWRMFHSYKDLFVKVQHAYGMTVHRAQGATRRHVYTCTHEVFNDSTFEAPRLSYVAHTRAAETLDVLI